jgi:hypothetical protein
MSQITNFIITFYCLDDSEKVLAHLNQVLETPLNLMPDTACNKSKFGNHLIEAPIIIGAYNHFDTDSLLKQLASYPWQFLEHVRCFVKEDYEGGFSEQFQDFVEWNKQGVD